MYPTKFSLSILLLLGASLCHAEGEAWCFEDWITKEVPDNVSGFPVSIFSRWVYLPNRYVVDLKSDPVRFLAFGIDKVGFVRLADKNLEIYNSIKFSESYECHDVVIEFGNHINNLYVVKISDENNKMYFFDTSLKEVREFSSGYLKFKEGYNKAIQH